MALKSGHLPRRSQLVLLVTSILSGRRGSTHIRSRRNFYPSRAHVEHVSNGTPSLGWWATPQWMHMLATGAVVDYCLAFRVWTIVCRSSLLQLSSSQGGVLALILHRFDLIIVSNLT